MEWDEPTHFVHGEPAHRAARRRHQSWWRQAELRAEAGYRPGRTEPVGSLLSVADVEAQPWLNFIHPAAYAHAERRIAEVSAGGGTLEPDRLRRNLLSSMPLCFNVFGALGDHPEFCWLLRQTFAPDAVAVIDVICEWSPRPKDRYLADNSAFDAAVWYIDDRDRRCVLGIEVKYTDDFSKKPYDTARYREVTDTSGWFVPGAADRLLQPMSNQLWRNTLLTAALERDEDVDRALVGVLALDGDAGAEKAIAAVRPELRDQGRLVHVTLEDMAAAADPHPEFTGWAEGFRRRYLGPASSEPPPPVCRPAPPRQLVPPERDYERSAVEPAAAAASSWQLAAHLIGSYEGLARVMETHPGGGQYDCLTLLPDGRSELVHHVDLNRAGSAFVWRTRPGGTWWAWRGIWDELEAGCSSTHAAALIANHAGLRATTRRWPASALTAALISTILRRRPDASCLNGLLDTSGYGGGVRRELFDDIGLTIPSEEADATRWWFICRHEKTQLAVDLPAGRAVRPDGSVLDLTEPGAAGHIMIMTTRS